MILIETPDCEYYAGIGNRYDVPDEIMQLIYDVAGFLKLERFGLRSGGAEGCDQQFEEGSNVYDGPSNAIYRPRHATHEAIKLASQFHPAWDACTDFVKKLHGRNAQIILGRELNKPARFVICYTRDEQKGGTALGLKIARANHIQVYNLANQADFDYWAAFI